MTSTGCMKEALPKCHTGLDLSGGQGKAMVMPGKTPEDEMGLDLLTLCVCGTIGFLMIVIVFRTPLQILQK